MENQYSVLMSVYGKDRPEYLSAAIDSILRQTWKARDIVLVCDGPLPNALNQVIAKYEEHLTVVKLSENRGLGAALAKGLPYCECEWIARMDSDDIAAADRCERQMEFVKKHGEIDALSGTIAEFEGDYLTEEEAKTHVAALKSVPQTHEEVARYIKYRNPLNHPCVMFKKSSVQKAGGYMPCPLFEDYDLWVRMFLNHCRFSNLSETVLYMRVNGMHQRRGGIRYVKPIAAFWTKMYRRKMISFGGYLGTMTARIAVSLLPNRIRKNIYDKKLRKH